MALPYKYRVAPFTFLLGSVDGLDTGGHSAVNDGSNTRSSTGGVHGVRECVTGDSDTGSELCVVSSLHSVIVAGCDIESPVGWLGQKLCKLSERVRRVHVRYSTGLPVSRQPLIFGVDLFWGF